MSSNSPKSIKRGLRVRADCKFTTGTDYSQVALVGWLWGNGFVLDLPLFKDTSINRARAGGAPSAAEHVSDSTFPLER